MRFSQVGISPLAAVHTKKETLLRALVLQMAFQGKDIDGELCKNS